MTVEQRKRLLLEYKLSAGDFFVSSDQHGDLIIIKRTGIDKLERMANLKIKLDSIETIPYKDRVSTTIMASCTHNGETYQTTASANPDNCAYPNYAEVAEKRVRHRILLQILKLYQHGIFSVDESDKFIETRNQYTGVVADVKKQLGLK